MSSASDVRVQRNHLVLAGLHTEQRYIHAVLHTDHDVLPSASGLDDDACLHPLELPLGDAHPIPFHQPVRFGCIDRQFIAIGFGNPFQIGHLLVRQVGIIPATSVTDPRQETVLGKESFQTIDLCFRGVYEDVIVQQRMLRADQFALFLADGDVRRSKIFERLFADTDAPSQLGLESFGRVAPVISF